MQVTCQSVSCNRYGVWRNLILATWGLNLAVCIRSIMNNSVCLPHSNSVLYFSAPSPTPNKKSIQSILQNFIHHCCLPTVHFWGFKIFCSNLAVTAVRLVEILGNKHTLSSVCLSVYRPALTVRFLASDRFPFSNLLIWIRPLLCVRVCVTKCASTASLCVFSHERANLCACLRGMVVCICPADWVLVKHFQMVAAEIRTWLS